MHQTMAIPQRQRHHWQQKTGKTATSSAVAIAIGMTIQLLTNSCKHTCVGLLAGQQAIQSKYNSTASDKLAKIASSAWWHAGALRLKLGKRAGVPAYTTGGGETTKPRDQEPKQDGETKPKQDHKHHATGGGGGYHGVGGRGGGAPARHHI